MIDARLYTPVTYAEMMVTALARFPDRPALVFEAEALTYRMLAEQVSRAAQALSGLGLRAGDCLAQLSTNRPGAVVIQFAAWLLGLRYLPLHPLGAADDHAFIVADAEAVALIYEPGRFDSVVAAIAAGATGLRHVLPQHWWQDVPATPAPLVPQPSPDGIVMQLYTGGTTGRPKGIMLSDRAMTMNVALCLGDWEWPRDIRFLCATPITHASGCMLIPILLRGGTVFLQGGFDADRFLQAIAAHRITAAFLVPTMIYLLTDRQRHLNADTGSLETVIYGGSPIAPARLREAIELFGPVFMQIYSQAEAPNCATILRRHEHLDGGSERLASCGRPLAGITVKILDDDGRPVAPGQAGEVCFRGPSIMSGYWQRPDETAAALRDGWLHTGDVARQDSAGYLFIVDRRKEMIVTGGFNVYPREVEDVLAQHPAVAAAAVIGVPDGKWGEAVKAVVVLRGGMSATPDELIALVRARKGPVAAPKSVDFAAAIPLTALGKPDKKVLRARYWGSEARQVH